MDTLTSNAIAFGLDATVKATVLFVLALCLVAALGRASAAVRHLAAALGLAGALALPFAALWVPRLSVPLVPSLLPAASCPSALAPPPPATDVRPSRVSGSSAVPRPAWTVWALAIWAAGALIASTRLLLGSLRVRAIERNSEPLCDSEWIEMAQDIARRLRLKRPVRILASADVPVAMTAGAFRPVLLLNCSARQWHADRRRVVLLHELAHVLRRDWLTLLVSELTVGIYWFHPLAWLIRREAHANGERACDDVVIGQGTKPSVYAAHLLDVVRSFASSARPALPALAMARPSQFEGRMRAILAPGLHRRGPSGRQVRGAAAGLFGLILALAALQPATPRTAQAAVIRNAPGSASPAPAPATEPLATAPKNPTTAACQSNHPRVSAKKKCTKKKARSGSPSLAPA